MQARWQSSPHAISQTFMSEHWWVHPFPQSSRQSTALRHSVLQPPPPQSAWHDPSAGVPTQTQRPSVHSELPRTKGEPQRQPAMENRSRTAAAGTHRHLMGRAP